MLDKRAHSVVEVYLSGILFRAGASMVCLLDSGSELKNSQMNTILKQYIYSNPYRPQGNSRIENIYNFLKEHLVSFFPARMPIGIKFCLLPVTASTLHQHQMI